MVEGNLIGTNASGTAMANTSEGVLIQDGGTSNTVGGTSAGAGNVISGNGGVGVSLDGTSTTSSRATRPASVQAQLFRRPRASISLTGRQTTRSAGQPRPHQMSSRPAPPAPVCSPSTSKETSQSTCNPEH